MTVNELILRLTELCPRYGDCTVEIMNKYEDSDALRVEVQVEVIRNKPEVPEKPVAVLIYNG